MAMKLIGRRNDVDMTEGNIVRHILEFALPLLIGNLFQQLYNTVDTWVVGNYVSNEAFSAVGTVSPIINMLIGTFMGFSSGAGVVISQYYGAKNEDKVHDAVHTAIMLTIILTIALTAIGVSLTPFLLRMMKTPDDVYPQSWTYLTIYFGGMVGLLFYNMGAGILRAVGDSQRPFYFLVVCAVLNTILDLLFVIKFQMGVAGVAWATVISQFISAVLIVNTLLRSRSCIRLHICHIRIHRDMLGKIIKVGIPSALQMAVTAFSNVFVQSYINQFGSDCMGGWTAYSKLDSFIFMPMQSLALASTTFVGQNLGKSQVARAKRGVRYTLICAMTSTVLISAIMIIFAPTFVAFFNSNPAVVEYGTSFLRHMTPFYFLCSINQVYSAALRGAGNSRAPMIIMLCSFVAFRQIYLFVVSHFICNEIIPLAMGYPAGWIVCSTLSTIYYHRVDLSKTKLVD